MITEGFDVLVQLVIAAMTTAPCPILCVSPSISVSAVRGMLPFAPAVWSGNALRKLCFMSPSDTRSCGRRGPDRLDSTSPRSRCSTSVYSGSGESSVRNSPCAFAYASTSVTCASSRPLPRR